MCQIADIDVWVSRAGVLATEAIVAASSPAGGDDGSTPFAVPPVPASALPPHRPRRRLPHVGRS